MEEDLNLTNCSCQVVSEVELWVSFILREVSIPLVGSVGVVGNLAAIIVLIHPDMKSTFHQSLVTLAVFEILFLILQICSNGAHLKSELYLVLFPYFLYPLKSILISCESYLLVSIALERLIAVARPLWYRTARLRLSSWYHALVFILPTLVISVSINIPKFFELKLASFNVTDMNNITRESKGCLLTSFRLHPDYSEYYILTRLLGTSVLPILFLLLINTSIYLSLQRQRPTNTTKINNNNNNIYIGNGNEKIRINSMLSEEQITENRRCLSHSARTLSAIVIMYVTCNIPRLALDLTEYRYGAAQLLQSYSECGCINIIWLDLFLKLNSFLRTISSSVNFIIYWSVGKQFKSTVSGILTKTLTKIRCRLCFSTTNTHLDV